MDSYFNRLRAHDDLVYRVPSGFKTIFHVSMHHLYLSRLVGARAQIKCQKEAAAKSVNLINTGRRSMLMAGGALAAFGACPCLTCGNPPLTPCCHCTASCTSDSCRVERDKDVQ